MKTSKYSIFSLRLFSAFLVVLFLLTIDSGRSYAQNKVKQGVESHSNFNVRKFMFENDRVRISEIRLEPGQRSEVLEFDLPGYMYISKPSKLQFYWVNKLDDIKSSTKGKIINITEHHWTESEPPHVVVNVGDEEFLAIRFEVKARKQ